MGGPQPLDHAGANAQVEEIKRFMLQQVAAQAPALRRARTGEVEGDDPDGEEAEDVVALLVHVLRRLLHRTVRPAAGSPS